MFWLVVALTVVPIIGRNSGASSPPDHSNDHKNHPDRPDAQKQPPRPPNFVIVLTDDLDWTLGGTHASTLRRTRRLLGEQGTTFTNWFVQTPVCCPSRAELLTGKMYHNLRMPSLDAGQGCMHIDVTSNSSHPFYQRDYFAQHFQRLNYTVGIFGKHLNSENPTDFIPNGVDEMLINGGGLYYDPTFTVGSRGGGRPQSVQFDNCTNTTGMPCYSTSIIGNASLAWIRRQMDHRQSQLFAEKQENLKPFLALISVKAPHILDGPGFPVSIPAPWYQSTTIPEEQAPRTPNYNYSAPDHHWIVRNQLPLTEEEAKRVDALYVSRLKTLLSVDDLVEDLMHQLEPILNHTYVIFTSDNGYRLGQFRMPMCKLHPYENDIRVPMMMRGPGIRSNRTSPLWSTHVNLMPTLLGLADRHSNRLPTTMDGTNLASCILENDKDDTETAPCPSASSLLVEYTSLGTVVRYNHTIDTYNHSFMALRMMQPHDDDDGRHETLKDVQQQHWMYSFDFTGQYDQIIDPRWNTPTTTTTTMTVDSTRHGNPTVNANANQHLLQNMKYIEYRDSRDDWNATVPPLEQELFDLDQDPYELHNLVGHLSPVLLQALQLKVQRLFHCQGDSCRNEHASGIVLSSFQPTNDRFEPGR